MHLVGFPKSMLRKKLHIVDHRAAVRKKLSRYRVALKVACGAWEAGMRKIVLSRTHRLHCRLTKGPTLVKALVMRRWEALPTGRTSIQRSATARSPDPRGKRHALDALLSPHLFKEGEQPLTSSCASTPAVIFVSDGPETHC